MRFVAYGDRKGVATALRPSLHRPRRGGRPTGPGRLPPVRPGPQVPPDGGDVGEGLGEVHPLPGLPPGPAPGHLCTTNAIESLNHRAARSAERRGHFPSDEAAAELLWPAGLQHRGPPGRGARQGEEHARPLAQGQRVDSSRDRSPPTGSRPWPSSPPPTPTESTPISDRTRLHRNIDRLAAGPGRGGHVPGVLRHGQASSAPLRRRGLHPGPVASAGRMRPYRPGLAGPVRRDDPVLRDRQGRRLSRAGLLQGKTPGAADHGRAAHRRDRVPSAGRGLRGQQGRDRHHDPDDQRLHEGPTASTTSWSWPMPG